MYRFLGYAFEHLKYQLQSRDRGLQLKNTKPCDYSIDLDSFQSTASFAVDTSSFAAQHDDVSNNFRSSWALKADSGNKQRRHKMWQSPWLSTAWLTGFVLIFTTLWVSLLVLRHMSYQQNGLSLSLGNIPYLIEFGPPTILVIIICFWRQVDYSCKMLQPWANLWQGPTSAARSVLLDYVSAFQAVAFVKAVRHHNLAVLITIAIFVFLKIAVLFSTSLLVASSTPFVEGTTEFTLLSDFRTFDHNTYIWDPHGLDNSNGIDLGYRGDEYGRPTVTYQGVLQHGLTRPRSVIGDLTAQLYDVPEDREADIAATAIVRAFKPEARCEIGNPTHAGFRPGHEIAGYQSLALTVETPTCYLPFVYLETEMNWSMPSAKARGFHGYVDYRNCSVQSPSDRFDVDNGDWRWIIAVADMSYENTSKVDQFADLPSFPRMLPIIHSISVVVCDIDYTMVNATLLRTRDTHGNQDLVIQTIETPPKRQHLPGLSESILNQAVARSLAAYVSDNPFSIWAIRLPKLFYLLLLAGENKNNTPENLLKEATLLHTAKTVLNNVSQLFAHDVLVTRGRGTVDGSLTIFAKRLHVREISFWFVCGSLIFSSCGCFFLLWLRPQGVVSSNPSTIFANAAIMRTSGPFTRSILSSSNIMRRRALETKLGRYQFMTESTCSFALLAKEQAIASLHEEHAEIDIEKTWTPFSVRRCFIAFTIAISLCVIIILEILQIHSDQGKGLVDMVSSLTDDYFLYGTSAAMLCIATLYNYIDFTVTALSPFTSLSKQPCAAQGYASAGFIGSLPIVNLIQALYDKKAGLIMSNLAGILGSTLAIAGSALWTLQTTEMAPLNMTLARADMWNFTNPASNKPPDDFGRVSDLILRQNLTYPTGTHRELAFPRLTLEQDLMRYSSDPTRPWRYEVTIPTLRGNLRCDAISDAVIMYNAYVDNGVIDQIYFPSVVAELPPGCSNGNAFSQFSWGLNSHFNHDGRHLGQINPLNLSYVGNKISSAASGCPSFAIVYGLAQIELFDEPHNTSTHYPWIRSIPYTSTIGKSSPQSDLTIFFCYEGLEEVMAKVSLTFESNSLNKQNLAASMAVDRPPVTIESTTQLLTNDKDGTNSFDFKLTYPLRVYMREYFSELNMTAFRGIDVDSMFRSFLKMAGFGPQNYEAFTGRQNNSRLIEVFTDVWHVFATQMIDKMMRVPLEALDSSDIAQLGANSQQRIFPAKAIVPAPRIAVNRVAKLVLQCLLAAMMLCLMGCFFTSRLRNTLPSEPCSIASRMSLIAASELVEQLPQGAEWMSDKEMDSFLKDKGWEIGMGWWDKSGQTKFFKANTAKNRDLIKDALSVNGPYSGDMRRGWQFGIDIKNVAERSDQKDLITGWTFN